MAMAITDQTDPAPRKGPSMIVQIAVLLVLTGAAVGGGWFAGNHLGADTGAIEPAAHPAPAEVVSSGDKAEGGGAPISELLVNLAPITTNLAAPNEIWARLEVTLLLDSPQPPELIETVHQDLLAYLRTVKMHQIEGASGYQHLKADLDERARIRSDGHVKQVLVRTLLFE